MLSTHINSLTSNSSTPSSLQRRKFASRTITGSRSSLLLCMASQNAGKPRTGSLKRPGQDLDRNTAANNMAVDEPPRLEDGITSVPLKYVVQEAVKRWFEDTMVEAQRGDVKQQALLGQMYAEGYGVQKDNKLAKEWTDKAACRGYRMQGVYCEL